FLRRSWVSFERSGRTDALSTHTNETPSEVAARIHDSLLPAETLRLTLQGASQGLDNKLRNLIEEGKAATELVSRVETAPSVRAAVASWQESGKALSTSIDELQELLRRADEYLASLSATSPLARLLSGELGALQQQLNEVYSMVSLGLTAEALSHELQHIAD